MTVNGGVLAVQQRTGKGRFPGPRRRLAAPLLSLLVALGTSCASAKPQERTYRTANPAQRWKTSGALLFATREAVKDCFAVVYAERQRGFNVCEPKTKAVLPAGLGLRILEKYDADAIAKVMVLEGQANGEVGFIHEIWITPSPWSKR